MTASTAWHFGEPAATLPPAYATIANGGRKVEPTLLVARDERPGEQVDLGGRQRASRSGG